MQPLKLVQTAERTSPDGIRVKGSRSKNGWIQGLHVTETRQYDWDVLKFQADFDPKYRRAQMRYMGTGAAGKSTDNNTVPSEHFTFSTMVLPPACEGPQHIHTDVEEVFFMLRGRIRLTVVDGDNEWETVLKERDLISVPPGVYRGLINEGQEEALMCVMLGATKACYANLSALWTIHWPQSDGKRNKGCGCVRGACAAATCASTY